jgi:hypothetical protein
MKTVGSPAEYLVHQLRANPRATWVAPNDIYTMSLIDELSRIQGISKAQNDLVFPLMFDGHDFSKAGAICVENPIMNGRRRVELAKSPKRQDPSRPEVAIFVCFSSTPA